MSVDTFAAAGHYAEHLGLTFPLLGDWPRYETGKKYGVFDEERSLFRRVTFVVDTHGIVRARIEDGTLKGDELAVDVASLTDLVRGIYNVA